jgi:hypothetical protein
VWFDVMGLIEKRGRERGRDITHLIILFNIESDILKMIAD